MNLVYRSPKNPNSHLTVKERKGPSFPTRFLWKQGYLSGRILDFGCGLGVDVAFLQSKNYEVYGYDPYYYPELPQGKFDTILCLYVLNVLLPEEQAHVLMAVSELLKPAGRAFFAVRRDLRREGFRTHIKHGVDTYQCNVKLPYQSIFCSENSEIYEYRHYNQCYHPNPHQCPFCSPEPERELITESATAYSLLDKYPVSLGHSLVIPKKHLSDYFDLSNHTKTALWIMVERVKDILEERFHPDGFNVGFNVGEAAGQTIPHVHIHVIPRYRGDVENPRGGIRHVLPGKGFYPDEKNLNTGSDILIFSLR